MMVFVLSSRPFNVTIRWQNWTLCRTTGSGQVGARTMTAAMGCSAC